MTTQSYLDRRHDLKTYFDRTAADAWAKLTTDAPVSGVRATVRAGRDRMRATLMSWLPDDLTGARLLDAGCGTGLLSVEAARRGAHVVAVDLSPTLVGIAQERMPEDVADRIEFYSGDMLDASRGRYDFCVAMDSLIHYKADDLVSALSGLAALADQKVLFTFAPRTLALSVMHSAGKLFPRSDRSPAIEPIAEAKLSGMIAKDSRLAGFTQGRSERIVNGFYTSNAMELSAS
ncbi:SAM-dependent methlyltransferase [Rhodomicrobium udaipurense JA643]|jgi:magnesium-protoporphyrin O-methyltransferase|uniref:Magnesium protoporphyrin IX methyltransferase n=1 Tax=Rhodomicrobium udaipurense TaxID=1202716 RepID=A0A8I1KLI5_9HYPH|nr:magnesium protoporphyrin IX methyltransferase [Rhodomicrobium udaipurense]KAI95473.1 SAM-dependent methlyltransferase [Rhodomicrobium udaipurense JA643]MBJ7543448.1 magnesium protoporphyrin IX methyltransferase [Rhodomicrobium udaipurense]